MKAAKTKQNNQSATPDNIRLLLNKTDWSEYTRRVVKEVARKAEEYKEADAKSLEGASQQVFVQSRNKI